MQGESIKMGIVAGIRDFKKGLGAILSKPTSGEGDRKLAKMSMFVLAQVDVYGKDAVRTQLIKSIEGDFKRAYRKDGDEGIEKLIANALATPEYVRLLHRVGLEEPHIRVIAMGVKKDAK